jgi:type II secretory pathway pseudopilin PulG
MGKTLLKILVALVLIAVLVAISIIKSNLSASREASRVESFKQQYLETQDSVLLEYLDDSTRFYIDSLQELESFYRSRIDSLNRQYAYKESLAAEEKASTSKDTSREKKPEKHKIDSTAIRLLNDYKSMIKKLPNDLTRYEKKVTFNELVIELSDKYKLSPDSVRKVIKK